MNGHRQLRIWQLAGDLIVEIYGLTKTLPMQERYVAVDQLRRAAWSVQNNIAEGNAKKGPAELRRFFDIALGSLAEVDSMIATLSKLYPQVELPTTSIEVLRRQITAGIFSTLRNPR